MLDMKQGEIDAVFLAFGQLQLSGVGVMSFGSDDEISDHATFPTPLGQLYINSHQSTRITHTVHEPLQIAWVYVTGSDLKPLVHALIIKD